MINDFLDVYVDVVEAQVIDYSSSIGEERQTKVECTKNALTLIENRNIEAKVKSYIRRLDDNQVDATFKTRYMECLVEFGLVTTDNSEELPSVLKELINALKQEFAKVRVYQDELFNISNTFQVRDGQPGLTANNNRVYTITFKVLYQEPLY